MNGTPTRVTLYARGDAPVAAREQYRTVERRLDGLDVPVEYHTWPRRVALDIDDDPPTLRAYRRFEAWARDRGVSLEPAFLRDVRENAITDERHEVLVTPTLCLAVHGDEDLLDVYPHRANGVVNTVSDGLDALAATVGAKSHAGTDPESPGLAD